MRSVLLHLNQPQITRYTVDIRKMMPTFVPDHPSLKAASWAKSSPNPNINPLTNGSRRLIAAPLNSPQIVGGLYSINGELDEEGGEGESSLLAE
jgi:hypothetical protein